MAELDNKYLTRCHYYGRLKDIEYISGATVLVLSSYVATSYYGNSSPVRIYVPTDMEDGVINRVTINENYYIIAAPYKVQFNKQYRHRVDLLLNIFEEIL